MTVKEIAKKCGCSTQWIYKLAKQLGRKPTIEEVLEKRGKSGRPPIHFKKEDN